MAATLNLQKECANYEMKHIFGYTLELEYEGEKVEMKVYAQTQRGMRNLLRIQKEIMVDSDNRTLSLQGLLTRGRKCIGAETVFLLDEKERSYSPGYEDRVWTGFLSGRFERI